MKARRGVILILSIFIAMVCFLAAAMMLSTSRQAFDTARLDGRRVQQRWAAKGATAELYYNMKYGAAGVGERAEAPVTLGSTSGVAWVTADPDHPSVYHIRSRFAEQESARVVIDGAGGGSTLFAAHTDQSDGRLAALFSKAEGNDEWNSVPLPTNPVYDSGGNLIPSSQMNRSFQTDLRGGLYITTGGSEGFSFLRYNGSTWENLPALPDMERVTDTTFRETGNFVARDLISGNWCVSPDGGTLYCARFDLPSNSQTGGAPLIQVLDLQSQSWSHFHGPARWSYSPDGSRLPQPEDAYWTRFLNGLVADNETLYAIDPSGLNNTVVKMDRSGNWDRLPPVPNRYYQHGDGGAGPLVEDGTPARLFDLALTAEGELVTYSLAGTATSNGLGGAFLRLDPNTSVWETTRPPYVDDRYLMPDSISNLELLSVDGNGRMVMNHQYPEETPDNDPLTYVQNEEGEWESSQSPPAEASGTVRGAQMGGGIAGSDGNSSLLTTATR